MNEEFYKGKDDVMLDELSTFFLAGMKTIQLTTANTIMYLTELPELRERLLNEITPVMQAAAENIIEDLTYEKV